MPATAPKVLQRLIPTRLPRPWPARDERLWRFHGGLHPPDEKALSRDAPIAPLPVPEQLVIPLRQHIGVACEPCVRVGDPVLKGQPIGLPNSGIGALVHASSSGRVIAIEPRPVAHPSGLHALCVVIDTDGADTWTERPAPLSLDAEMPLDEVRRRIHAAGIVGLGGATFPTSIKLDPGPHRRIQTLILNGAECEPYLTCDDRLMRERPERVLAGARLLRDLLGAERVLIGIEDNKPEAVASLRATLAAMPRTQGIRVRVIPTLYPSGGEKQLIRLLTGQEVPSHTLPSRIGILCQNVGTAAAIAEAVFASRPLISRIVTLSGRAWARTANLEVPIGTPIATLIEHLGGYRTPPRKLVCGGPMMGFALPDPAAPVTKSVNAILALTAAESPDPGPARACIRCGRCAEVCPARLLPQQLYWHARAKDFDKVQDYQVFDCIECGCCAQVCPSHIPLVHYYRFAKNAIWAREQERRKAETARARHAARQARLERQERERQARLRQKQEALTPTAPDTTT